LGWRSPLLPAGRRIDRGAAGLLASVGFMDGGRERGSKGQQ
jgi:hypothetical protein